MKKTQIGIIVSDFNKEITYAMLNEARDCAKNLSAKVSYICYVPGVFDMPLLVEEMLKKNNVDAVVTLGAIIKGETDHDKLIAYNTARILGNLSLKYKKPVSLGITGPTMTMDQAKSRIKSVSHHSVVTAISMVDKLKKIRNNKMKNNKEMQIID